MSRSHRHGRLGWRVGLGVTVMATLVLSGQASAAPTPPPWTSGHFPTCNSFTVDTTSDPALITYTDRTLPKILSLTSRTYIVDNHMTRVRLGVTHATDSCSGIGGATISVRIDQPHGPRQYGNAPLGIYAGTPWDAWLGITVSASAKEVGKITLRGIEVLDRYATVTLDPFNRYSSSTPSTSHPSTAQAFAYNGVTFKLLRRTTLSISVRDRSVASGASTLVSGKLVVANGTTWVPVVGHRVWLQRRYSAAQAWRSVRSALTSAAGTVSIRHRPLRKVYYRLMYAGSATDYNASSHSRVASMRVS